MYSDNPHVIDVFNDSSSIRANLVKEKEDGQDVQYLVLRCRLKKEEILPDSTGTIYAHMTDAVQHMRIPITPVEEEKASKGKK